jgi:hypothetical protein
MCALLKPGRLFNMVYKSGGRSMSPLANFSIAVASLSKEDVNAATRGSPSKSQVLALLFGLVEEDDAPYSKSVAAVLVVLVGLVGTLLPPSSTATCPASSTPTGSLDPFAYFPVAMLFSNIVDIAA